MAYPTIPPNRIVGTINMDMIGRLREDRLTIYGTRTSVGLRRLISSQNGPSNLLLDFDWEIKPDSDHYTFIEHAIPALMFHTGLHSDYHRPSDDVEKINVSGLQRIVRLLVGVVAAMADEPGLGGFRPISRSETIVPSGSSNSLCHRCPAAWALPGITTTRSPGSRFCR